MIDEIKNYDMRVFLAFQRVIHREGLESPVCRKYHWM